MISTPMFFITAIQSAAFPAGHPYKRCFGFRPRKHEAIHSVRINEGNLHECLYDYIVIERFSDGIHPICNFDMWFHWTGARWKQCGKKPDFAKGIVNWAIG